MLQVFVTPMVLAHTVQRHLQTLDVTDGKPFAIQLATAFLVNLIHVNGSGDTAVALLLQGIEYVQGILGLVLTEQGLGLNQVSLGDTCQRIIGDTQRTIVVELGGEEAVFRTDVAGEEGTAVGENAVLILRKGIDKRCGHAHGAVTLHIVHSFCTQVRVSF